MACFYIDVSRYFSDIGMLTFDHIKLLPNYATPPSDLIFLPQDHVIYIPI